ncbi:pyrE Orotate phosphoribosyltransferase [uncultured Caudovirales phage]|uniref:PyrE Orotate phosphoribosyltransferase n=1 Tax=uncultured Caudovirales phage TaxID=2100421 RepID=A0A6J5QK79_9CAUD|nr:pyrE Orotate phosphoribosyltransferase [uncultured Caudovirales phage]
MIKDEKHLLEMRRWLKNYINHTCIYRAKLGTQRLIGKAPNTSYSWQFYLRRGLFNAKFLNIVGVLFWHQFAERYRNVPFQVTGLETGATPVLVAIAMTSHLFDIDVNVISTRANRKKYGLLNRFEGIIDYNLPVMIVDDMCNSKDTIVRCLNYVAEEGLRIYDEGWTVVNKDVDGSHPDHDKYIGDSGLKIRSIFSLSEFDLSWNDYVSNNLNVNEVEFITERHLQLQA